MLYRYLGSPQNRGGPVKNIQTRASVASWARDAMEWAVVVGVIQGTDDLRLNPSRTATRMDEMASDYDQFSPRVSQGRQALIVERHTAASPRNVLGRCRCFSASGLLNKCVALAGVWAEIQNHCARSNSTQCIRPG